MDVREGNRWEKAIQGVVVLGMLLSGLFWARTHSYALFHSLSELFSVVIAGGVFMVAWNARQYHRNAYLVFLGAGFLCVAGLDLVHTLAYKGMTIFPGYDSNLPTQLWVAARYVESLTLLAATLLIGRRPRSGLILGGFAVIGCILLVAIFQGFFPDCLLERSGLTPFKRISEYVICIILMLAMVGLWWHRAALNRQVLYLLLGATALTVVQELCFTLYTDPYQGWNFVGHCLKILAFSLVYVALVETGIARPVELLFRDLDLSKKRLELAQQAARVGTFEWDLATRGNVMIAGMEAVYGTPPGTTSSSYEDWRRRLHPDDVERVERLLADVLAGKAEYNTQFRVFWPDGSVHWVEARGELIRDEQSHPACVLGINMEITERKRVEQELQQARHAAESANQAKDQFLAVLSHELRTPLTPVATAAQVLATDTELSADAHELVAMIRRNVELETRLIDDMLDLTRISRGKIVLHLETVDVHQQIGHVVQMVESEAAAKQVRLNVEDEAMACHVQADPTRLQQVLWNLLKNAVKFTPPGGQVTVRTRNNEGGRLSVEVQDTGIGIEADMIPRLFNAFEQGGEGTTRRFGGLGLGLAISKGLVDQHRGTLSAYSRGRGKGATFIVNLPTTVAPQAGALERPGERKSAMAGNGRRLLLVEDHVDTARMMARLLRGHGYEVIIADGIASALRMVQGQRFDLLVSDIGLSDGSGLDLMRQIRNTYGTGIRGIALSGFGMDADIRRSEEAGFSAHLVKPVNLRQLEETIGQVLGPMEIP